jgi:hypothetical protein
MKLGGKILCAIGLVIVGFAVVLTILEVNEGNAGPHAPNIHGNAIKSANGRARTCANASQPVVDAIIHSYDPSSNTIVLDTELCVPRTTLVNLIVSRGHARIITETGTHTMAIRVGYKRLQFALHAIALSPNIEAAPSHNVELANLVRANGSFVKTASLALPLTGSFLTYPFDSYSLTAIFHLSAQDKTVALVTKTGYHATPVLPVTLNTFVGADVAPLGVETQVTSSENLAGRSRFYHRGRQLGVQLERRTRTQLFVSLIALVPLLLGGLLLIVILKGNVEAVSPGSLAGLAAVLFAILPIRQVLIPSGSNELTLVDYALGLEMAIVVLIACVAVALTMKETTE